jgi:predicted amidophosphoribosyltransferase
MLTHKMKWLIDLIIPIPPGKKRLKELGYNQVGMIARPLELAMEVENQPNGLKRVTETRSQVGLSKRDRKDNVLNAFGLNIKIANKVALAVEDVSTSGASLSSAAQALFSCGAKDDHALTVARALKIEHA